MNPCRLPWPDAAAATERTREALDERKRIHDRTADASLSLFCTYTHTYAHAHTHVEIIHRNPPSHPPSSPVIPVANATTSWCCRRDWFLTELFARPRSSFANPRDWRGAREGKTGSAGEANLAERCSRCPMMPCRGADRLDHSAHGFYRPGRDSSGLLPHREHRCVEAITCPRRTT